MTFLSRYETLNDNQRAAVDHLYGPLLVIAGPGTGKTELLSMRAAHILQKTDTLPSSILCLTFTESGAVNMRERLRDIIGEDAYKIAIHTFHSFGTEIINQHREYFFRGAEMKPTDELTQYQILQELFGELDWQNPLSTKNNDAFVYLPDTLRTISEFKQSGLTPDELRLIVDDNERVLDAIVPDIAQVFSAKISKKTISEFAPLAQKAAELEAAALPSAITPYHNVLALSLAHAAQEAIDSDSTKPITAWKNSWCEKDANNEFTLKDVRAAEKFRVAIDIYERYQQVLSERQLFDYDDMILSVLRACETNADLRANLQEQYQFIMVDEFQDTNLAQLRLLFTLTGEELEPNIMAVGDDDQAIFSFQGADIGNIQRFRERYNNPPIIVLTDNYRSNIEVLTSARTVITQGTDRLEYTITSLSKELTAHASSDGARVAIHEYQTPAEERAGVASSISQLIESGVKPENIAILARRHNELIDLLPYLSAKNIAVNYERRDDVLEQDIVRILEQLARIILSIHTSRHDETNTLLRDVIAHPAFGFSAHDIWSLSLQAWRNRALWLETMRATPGLAPFANWLIERASQVPTEPLERQLDVLLGRDESEGEYISPLASYFFSTGNLQKKPDAYISALESLRTLRDRLREHYDTTNPTLAQLIDFIDLYRSTGTRLTTVRTHADSLTGAIHLMSAHKAKGLEFPHVFIIGAVDSGWGEKSRSRSRLIRYPANLPLAPAGATYDERLRLFFVAMTRAKTTLDISYACTDTAGKDTMVASFLSSYTPDIASTTPDIASQTYIADIDWNARLTAPITGDLRDVLSPVLESYKLSATHLNNFLDVSRGGPQTFLLNNLLRFPQSKSPSAGYGTAMHACLQFAHNSLRVDGTLPSEEQIIAYFVTQLEAQRLLPEDFTRYSEQGKAALLAFLKAKQHTFTASQLTELNFASQGVVVGDARLTGALDLVDINKEDRSIFVTDYKTGRPSQNWKGSSEYEKIKLHKYRQQLMFYQLLVEGSRDYSGYRFIGGRLQFIEPEQRSGDILALEEVFSSEDLADFKRLIAVVWDKITTLDLPDISDYEPTYKGMIAFEHDLLDIN